MISAGWRVAAPCLGQPMVICLFSPSSSDVDRARSVGRRTASRRKDLVLRLQSLHSSVCRLSDSRRYCNLDQKFGGGNVVRIAFDVVARSLVKGHKGGT